MSSELETLSVEFIFRLTQEFHVPRVGIIEIPRQKFLRERVKIAEREKFANRKETGQKVSSYLSQAILTSFN